jgi:hypothetical protein
MCDAASGSSAHLALSRRDMTPYVALGWNAMLTTSFLSLLACRPMQYAAAMCEADRAIGGCC